MNRRQTCHHGDYRAVRETAVDTGKSSMTWKVVSSIRREQVVGEIQGRERTFLLQTIKEDFVEECHLIWV